MQRHHTKNMVPKLFLECLIAFKHISRPTLIFEYLEPNAFLRDFFFLFFFHNSFPLIIRHSCTGYLTLKCAFWFDYPPICLKNQFWKIKLDELNFYLVWTWFLLPVKPAKFKFEIDKKSSSSNLGFQIQYSLIKCRSIGGMTNRNLKVLVCLKVWNHTDQNRS